mmetsp:Transcript_29409/g.53194  ORF Transcript_29409/g.53194 Transcript_29409/m.53194 type:complete len:133 (+) Transcript_29409:708-1106(+)
MCGSSYSKLSDKPRLRKSAKRASLSSSYANFFIFTACKLDGLKAETISSCQLSPPNMRLKYVKKVGIVLPNFIFAISGNEQMAFTDRQAVAYAMEAILSVEPRLKETLVGIKKQTPRHTPPRDSYSHLVSTR